MTRWIVACSCALSLANGYAQNVSLDPLHRIWADTLALDEERVNALARMSFADSSATPLSAASSVFRGGKADTGSVGFKRTLGLAESAFGRRDVWIDSNASATRHLLTARKLLGAAGDRSGSAHVDLLLGQIGVSTGDMEGAIRYLQPASQVLMAMGDTLGATTGAEMIGYALQLQGNRTAAQDQYEQALALIGHRHPQKRLDLLVQLSALHVEMNDANAALADLDEASVLVANGSAIDARDDLGAVKGEALTLQGKCQEALGLLFKSLERSKDRADRRDMKAYVLARIAAAQSCAGDHDLAYSSALEGLALADRCGYVKEQMDNLKALVAACEGKGDVDKAFAYSKRYHALGDSLADARTASAVTGALLTAEFRSAQVADSLTNVLVQRGSEAALSRSKAQRNILLIASLLVLIIAGLLLNRYRLKRRLHEERLRARLARDLHDDIGSTLSSISILSSVAQKRATAGDDGDAANALEKISDRSQRLMRDMSDIVWSVDPTKDAMSDLLIRMREFGTTILEPKGIAFNFVVPAHLPLTLPVEVKNNLYLIFKEAVNNAAKHARATTVDARLSWEKPILRLEVSDNGTGLGPASDESGHGGNGLRNMRERALEMKAELQVISHAGTGTRITLELQRRG